MTRRRVIFPAPEVWANRNDSEDHAMTDEPQYVTLELPADTVTLTATGATFILTASGDGKLVPELALHTNELGWYRILIPRQVFVSMLGQLDYLKAIDGPAAREMVRRLHGNTP